MRSGPVLLALALPACSVLVGQREVCGVRPEGGGPPVVRTRDQEMCELVRARFDRRFNAEPIAVRRRDELLDRTLSWQAKASIDALVDAVRRDAGDAFADEVRRAADALAAHPTTPPGPACEEDQMRCLVAGAAKGARVAIANARIVVGGASAPAAK